MYNVSNNIAYINGNEGKYDGVVKNSSVKYGRNAADNYFKYLEGYTVKNEAKFPKLDKITELSEKEFGQKMSQLDQATKDTDKWLNSLAPLEFEYRYMPSGKVDTGALMGAAYEELGKKTEITTEELTETMKTIDKNATAEAIDLNKDGKVDLAEYSTSILLADALSSKSESVSKKDVDGTITNYGQNKLVAYSAKENYDLANRAYRALYEDFGLESAKNEFLSDQNNLAS